MNDTLKINLGGYFLPRQLSTIAKDVDWAWDVASVVCAVFFALTMGAMFYFMWRFRRRGKDDKVSHIEHGTVIEVLWTVIPTAIVVGLFFVGFKGYLNGKVAEAESIEIHGVGEKWTWTFMYPNGTATINELRVPKDKPVRMILSSKDVLHSFFIPEFRVKQDAVPGTYNSIWFRATETGETTLLCAEYCGTSHSNMLAKVIIMDPAKYEDWLQNGDDDGKTPPAELGKKYYAEKSCATCHSLDGSRMTGPSWKGLYGRKEKLANGTEITVDENYIRESILQPGAKVVAGFDNVMPVFQGTINDKQVMALIEFIKTQK